MSGGAGAIQPIRLLLTGGGTGGHLFPALATADELRRRSEASEIVFIGTRRKLDREHLKGRRFNVRTIHSYGLKGKRPGALLLAVLTLPLSLCQACYHVLRFRPHVVLGVGGYVTGPVVAAAWLLRKPTVIHEQNSVPGMANRHLGRLVDTVCISLPQSAPYFPAAKTVLTGNPVRRDILETASRRRPERGRTTLLILGGSQGARAINELIVEVLSGGDPVLAGLGVIHQTGAADEERVKQAYRESGVEAVVSSFIADMASAYEQADLVVSRAGATTLAELSVLGKPAILIPYPHAADNHQETNASWYAESGGAIVLRQQDLTAERLAAELKSIIDDPEGRRRMSEAMRGLSSPDAAGRIVEICLGLAR